MSTTWKRCCKTWNFWPCRQACPVGERIKAFVVLKEDTRGVVAYDLITWCRERLAPYEVPHYIEFRDMLPKSKVGKLLRREPRAEERRKAEET
jgi:long-chain acyl-CoA synthetase